MLLMIGSVFHGDSNVRLRYLAVAGGGGAMLVLGLIAMPWMAIVGVTLLVAGLAGAAWPAPRFQVELRPDGLFFQPGEGLIPYASIVAVTGLRAPKDQAGLKPFPIDVCTAAEGLRIPAHPEVPARQLEEFLISRASPFITPPRDQDVSDFYDQECAKFGPDQVALHHGHTGRIETLASRHLRWFSLGWILGSFIALALGFNLYARNNAATGTAGVMVAVGIIMFLLTLVVDVHYGLKRQAAHTDDVLVVGPSGLALRQGKLKGKLRWDEVRNITMMPAAKNSGSSVSTGAIGRQCLHLKIDGATIVLLEVYDRSLSRIKQTIEYHCHNRGRVPGIVS
jgi:hypothetical protein